jgi:hypothetical protein
VLSRVPGIHPLSTVVLRLAWATRLLTIGMGVGGAVDSDEASGAAFWGASWEDGWAIAWRTVTPPPPQTRLPILSRARLAGVEGSTPRLARISPETSPRTPEVGAILARSGRATTSRAGEAVSNWDCVPARCGQGTGGFSLWEVQSARGSGMLAL